MVNLNYYENTSLAFAIEVFFSFLLTYSYFLVCYAVSKIGCTSEKLK